jgi:hypothetical protein
MHCGVDAGAVVGDEGVLFFCSSEGGLTGPIHDFHKKIRASGGGQEKSERMNSERTKAVNATPCGPSIG